MPFAQDPVTQTKKRHLFLICCIRIEHFLFKTEHQGKRVFQTGLIFTRYCKMALL